MGFLMKVVLFLVSMVLGLATVTPAFGDVLVCGKDVLAVNTESDHARKFGFDPDCYGRGVEAVVVPGDGKKQLEAAKADKAALKLALSKTKKEIAYLKGGMEKRTSELNKALDGLKKQAAPSAKPAVKPTEVKKAPATKKATAAVADKKISGDLSLLWAALGILFIVTLAALLAKVAQNFPSRLIMKLRAR